MPRVKTQIQNIVMSVTYKDLELNLERISKILPGARYDPEIFPGVTYKSGSPRASFLIFSSGKMNCVGANCIADAKGAIEKLTRKLRRSGIRIKYEPTTKVQNIVASLDFGREFDLEKIARTYENAEYEPEVFPGLVFRLEDPKVVVLIFVSGKCICAGAKRLNDVKRAGKEITRILS